MRARVAGLLLGPLLCGCATLVRPGPAHLSWAQAQDPGATLEILDSGRTAYADQCGGCHILRLPRSEAPGSWDAVLDRMEKEHEVVLLPETRAQVLLYLEAAATVTDEEIAAAEAAAEAR